MTDMDTGVPICVAALQAVGVQKQRRTGVVLERRFACAVAGAAAAQRAKDRTDSAALTLDHTVRWNAARAEAGLTDGRVAPVILPDYTRRVR
jgi:hypothetical protein